MGRGILWWGSVVQKLGSKYQTVHKKVVDWSTHYKPSHPGLVLKMSSGDKEESVGVDLLG